MSFLGRALPFLLLAVAAGCSSSSTEETASASESNLDEGDPPPPDGPLAPDASFGTNGALSLSGPAVAISAAKRADGAIGVLGTKGADASLTIIKADGSAQADVALVANHALSGIVLSHQDGLLVVGASMIDEQGRYFVSRVGADGAIDPAFTPDPLDLRPSAGAAAVTKDGHIIVAGSYDGHAAMVRLDKAGRLDPTFGDQGLWLASDDRADVTRLAVGADESIYVVTHGGDKTLLAHFSASGKPDSKFGTSGVATLPLDAAEPSRAALLVTDEGLRYFGPTAEKGDTSLHAFDIDAHGTVTPGAALAGEVVGFASTGLVTAVTEGDVCTVHVTEKATAALTASECRLDVSYVALGGGKRALISNVADGVSVRVYGD